MRVLCVAEKPSIAKSIAQILSGGQYNTRNTSSQFIKNYEFDYPQTRSQYTVTAVVGHLMNQDFGSEFKSWNGCDPFSLFEASIEVTVAADKKDIEKNLQQEARRAQTLMIWTDCDREGEHIGYEIFTVCRRANARIAVKRARFSAIIAPQIHNAAQHPVELDMSQVHSVEARIALDLRIGAAFTRLQTLALQNRFGVLKENVVSYGPCQFPTLGFVVARFNQVQAFRPETFWYIYLAVKKREGRGPEKEVVFSWNRGHLFDQNIALLLYQSALARQRGVIVTKVTNKNTEKWKPLPLTTVELQKSGSRLLKLAPKKILDIAEKLYQQGFLSYPRTETDKFDPQFDFMSLVEKQMADPAWGGFARDLHQGAFQRPRNGKNDDHAHPPIHPTAYAGNLTGDDKRVYEYVARRFLACCSKNALGYQTRVEVEYGGEEFHATGLIVLERNYLDVYPYDKWNDNELPNFIEGEEYLPSEVELRDGQTTKPNLLTEADLVNLMDKNGIGTDATIAQHIETIITREYVIERMEGKTKYLVPSSLGIGLIEGYDKIEFEKSLSKPQLRREVIIVFALACEYHD
ncbi:prokaryotic type I DNA topoisomerase [Thelephora ganbajun]|uniref:Prokaryotic type I DNA topoisomerase n=1 Tax=Thelephora ganbajun TaxID=370292 RepID=A0ACB6ZLV8_THEGA|nr:prokaryotic type I DNA topoisomerase [Thelephora ganbajun]